MDLPFDDHRIDHVSEIVDRGEPVDADHPGLRVDLDLADVGAGRVGEVGGVVEGVLVQARLELVQRVVVRHVGGKGHLGEGHFLVGAGNPEDALLELDVGVGRLEQVGGDLAALGDHLVDRLDDRGAAHRDRARAVGAHAEQDLAGVAVDDVDVLQRDAELVGDHLGKGGFVALAVAVRAGEHRDLAGGVHPHLARFEQARARAQCARDVGGRQAAGLDVAGVAEPAQPALPRGLRLAGREAGDVGELDGAREVGFVVAGVVGEADRRCIGEAADEVAPADLRGVELHFARGGLHQALDHVGGLGPARPAVGVHRRGVGEHPGDLAEDLRRGVLARQQRGVQDGGHRRGEGGQVGAQVRGGVHAHAEEAAFGVHRQLGGGDVVAAVGVGQEGLAALGGPLDRAVDLLRGPHQHRLLRVQEDLGAEAASDVGRHHAQLVLRDAQHEGRHQESLDVRVLVGDVDGVAVVCAAVDRIGGARLDRVGDQPVVAELQLRDVMGSREGGIGGAPVADRPGVADVVLGDGVHRGGGGARRGGVDHRRQFLVVDLDQRGGVLGLLQGLGDHDCDLVADVAHLLLGEQRVLRLLHRRAVDAGDQPAAGQAAHRRGVGAGEDVEHAGGRLRGGDVDRPDAGVRIGRAQEVGVGLALEGDVVGVLAVAGQEAVVLAAADRLADEACGGCVHVRVPWRFASSGRRGLRGPCRGRPAGRRARCSGTRCSGRSCRRAARGSRVRCRAGGCGPGRWNSSPSRACRSRTAGRGTP